MTTATGTRAATQRVLPGVQRHGSGDRATFRIRATGFVLLVAHLLLVGWLTLRPLHVPWVTPANLRPLATIRAQLALGPWEAVQSLGGGLLLLAPLGILLPVVTGRLCGSWLGSLAHTVFTGAMVSLAVELLQSNVSGRTVDVDSLLLNTAGVGLTHLVLTPCARAWLRRRGLLHRRADHPREGEAQGRTPTIPRVGIAP